MTIYSFDGKTIMAGNLNTLLQVSYHGLGEKKDLSILVTFKLSTKMPVEGQLCYRGDSIGLSFRSPGSGSVFPRQLVTRRASPQYC